jgi:hypothetical protein
MGNQAVIMAEFEAALTALNAQITALSNQMNNKHNHHNNRNNGDNNRINLNWGGEPIPVIRVRNNNHTNVVYKKSVHTCESDLEYYNFKISDSIYRCPFCYNKDYSLTDLLRHASRMAGNSRKTIKDIAKHSVLIIYIERYLNVKDGETFN